MNNPHLKLGDTSRFVKHLIRALRRSCMAYYFEPVPKGHWRDYRAIKEANYKHYTKSIRCVVRGFQMRNKIPHHGECDAATWAKLERFL